MQKVKVRGNTVQKLAWNGRTDKRTETIAFSRAERAPAVGNKPQIAYTPNLYSIRSAVYYLFVIQEAFEKCWAHSPQRAASRQFTRCR